MVLYESFRPEVPKGKAGWGQSGMLRLRTVLELRDQLEREKQEAGSTSTAGDGGGGRTESLPSVVESKGA